MKPNKKKVKGSIKKIRETLLGVYINELSKEEREALQTLISIADYKSETVVGRIREFFKRRKRIRREKIEREWGKPW